jgi:hypothetical protein
MDAFSAVAGHATSPAWHTSMPSGGASTPSKPDRAAVSIQSGSCSLQDFQEFRTARRPISGLARQTLTHADAWFDFISGFLVEPNDGRVGLKDLQIDLDAAERRQALFSF